MYMYTHADDVEFSLISIPNRHRLLLQIYLDLYKREREDVFFTFPLISSSSKRNEEVKMRKESVKV